jgi:UDP-N-acetylglucosamine--N-acetylmuramyl-(pentapeptide) pyrophosphoryl-undecaprenol N-acetylglucosamine transferase
MRVVLAGGGTGGHVYPALSVVTALQRTDPAVELLYLGTPGGIEERLVREQGIAFRGVHAGQVRGKSPTQVAASVTQIATGMREARKAIGAFAADAVFATGGYASVPVVLAASLGRVPVTVFLPDVYPGWAVRIAARLAARVATTTKGALEHLPQGKTIVTGYPLRAEFWQTTRSKGRERLGLSDGPCVLISGASTGSRVLNDAVLQFLLPMLENYQIIHLTGRADEARVQQARDQLPESLRHRYHVHGYLDDIAWALSSADVGVLRAGASCLAEPPAVGLPAILVPGSFSDQHRNADYMATEGAAIVVEEQRLSELPALIDELMSSPERLSAMATAARNLARPNAANAIAALVLEGSGFSSVPEACLQ